jgi:long-chain acyl-CoA synthetase
VAALIRFSSIFIYNSLYICRCDDEWGKSMSVLAQLDQIGQQLATAGQPFELMDATVNGISLRVYKNLPPNLTHLLVQAAGYADRTFIVMGDRRLTYAYALGRAASLAEILRAEYGAGPGERVAIAMRNSPE